RAPRSARADIARAAETRDGHQAVGCAGLDLGIVGTEVLDAAEPVPGQQRRELFTLPAAHREPGVADALLAVRDERMALGYQELPVLDIQLGDARERQLSALGRHSFPEERLARLPLRGGAPLADVQDQRAMGSKRRRECGERGVPPLVVEEVVEDAATQDSGV